MKFSSFYEFKKEWLPWQLYEEIRYLNFIYFFRQGPTTLSPEEQAAWATEKRCKRKPFAECSPSEGPCCESDCKFTDR